MIKKLLSASVAGFLCVCVLNADDDYELRINGDFRGATLGAAIAPGWEVVSGGGMTKIVRGDDFDEFAIKVDAGAQKQESVYSDFQPVVGNIIKIESEIMGNGIAMVGFVSFDADKKPLQSGLAEAYNVTAFWSETKNYFTISDPAAKYVKIVLTAEKGSSVTFREVEAEFKMYKGAGTAAPAVAPVVVPRATTASSPAAPAPAATVALSTPAPTTAVPAQLLINDKFYSLSDVGVTPYQVTLPIGGDIDFELEESADKGHYWTISGYDSRICRVEIDHDRGGVWPFRYDKAEIELKGIAPGTTTVTFSYADGRTFSVLFTVR